MRNSFPCTALEYFFPDLIVGGILGTILAIWIGRRTARFEQAGTEFIVRQPVENHSIQPDYLLVESI